MALTAPSSRSRSAFLPPRPPWRTQCRPDTLQAVVAGAVVAICTVNARISAAEATAH